MNDMATLLDNIDKRLQQAEQILTSPAVMGAGGSQTFTDITIDDGSGFPIPLNLTPPNDITGLTATPDSFFESLFVDVHWVAPATGTEPATYEVELATRSGATRFYENLGITAGTDFRFENLIPATTYSVRVTPISIVGVRGNTSAWVDFTSTLDSTIPSAPTGLQVFRSPGALIATWNANPEADVALAHGVYEVQISRDNFATIDATLRTPANVVSFDGINTEATYKVRVSAIDSSGNQGTTTTSGIVVAGSIITGQIQDSAIVASKLAAGSVTAASILAGTITATQIATASLTADRLATSTLTAANITLNGGAFLIGSPPTNGIVINSQGIRAYSSSSQTFNLDSVTGAATFTGTISGSYITGTFFDFGGGNLTSNGGLSFLISPVGYTPTRAVTFLKDVSPWTSYWTMWAANASELYIQRMTVDPGDYQWFNVLSQRSYFKDHNATPIGYFYENGGGLSNGLSVSGSFSANSKSFLIDHPLDPDKKLLHHGCLEGPEFGVFYRGQATVGVDGEVVVTLPDYFEKLTLKENRTVQVTALGSSSDLFVTYPADGKFSVYGKKGQKFFWLVHAERGDRSRIDVEYDKEELAGADAFFAFGGRLDN